MNEVKDYCKSEEAACRTFTSTIRWFILVNQRGWRGNGGRTKDRVRGHKR